MDPIKMRATRCFVASLYWSLLGNEKLSLMHAHMAVSWSCCLGDAT